MHKINKLTSFFLDRYYILIACIGFIFSFEGYAFSDDILINSVNGKKNSIISKKKRDIIINVECSGNNRRRREENFIVSGSVAKKCWKPAHINFKNGILSITFSDKDIDTKQMPSYENPVIMRNSYNSFPKYCDILLNKNLVTGFYSVDFKVKKRFNYNYFFNPYNCSTEISTGDLNESDVSTELSAEYKNDTMYNLNQGFTSSLNITDPLNVKTNNNLANEQNDADETKNRIDKIPSKLIVKSQYNNSNSSIDNHPIKKEVNSFGNYNKINKESLYKSDQKEYPKKVLIVTKSEQINKGDKNNLESKTKAGNIIEVLLLHNSKKEYQLNYKAKAIPLRKPHLFISNDTDNRQNKETNNTTVLQIPIKNPFHLNNYQYLVVNHKVNIGNGVITVRNHNISNILKLISRKPFALISSRDIDKAEQNEYNKNNSDEEEVQLLPYNNIHNETRQINWYEVKNVVYKNAQEIVKSTFLGKKSRPEPLGLIDQVIECLNYDLKSKNVISPNVIAIDPGHGGHDDGFICSNGLLEKEVTLLLAKKIRQKLMHLGFNAVLTRDDDRYIDIFKRLKKNLRFGINVCSNITYKQIFRQR